MKISVLGSGCKKCKKLLDNVNEAVKENKVEAVVEYVTEMQEIAKSGLLSTPGLLIDGEVVSYGKLLSSEEIFGLIKKKL